jgi:hypothetical protein
MEIILHFFCQASSDFLSESYNWLIKQPREVFINYD